MIDNSVKADVAAAGSAVAADAKAEVAVAKGAIASAVAKLKAKLAANPFIAAGACLMLGAIVGKLI